MADVEGPEAPAPVRKRHCTCSFFQSRATTSVSDVNDFFDCCAKCERAWQDDPGFQKDQRTLTTAGEQK